ncbi:hypothetical protein [Paenibacillus borealis]|uniref:Uncharacterized protein n=1 Tax=Paenibacillus borealis TaxID=160799 RepID=A0A089LC67_PAEBO|nr:hypothetical protein [Paenibacillus borealis]AIQ58392.1 hypothetical protein PBOR_16715 [Paenibacillus borealis]
MPSSSKRSKARLKPGHTYAARYQLVKGPIPPPQNFFRKYFWLLAVIAFASDILGFADRYYVTARELGVQQGLITPKLCNLPYYG